MSRLPEPRSDEGIWGDVLNDFLRVEHNPDGTLKDAGSLGLKEPLIADGTTGEYLRGDKTFHALNKAAVGLTNVDDTSDDDKPVSTDQAAAIATKPTWIGVDIHANRPAANAGQGLWVSSNINGGTQYYSDGNTWTQVATGVLETAGQELAYAEINALAAPWSSKDGFGGQSRAFTLNTAQDIAGLEVTWTPQDTRPIQIIASFSQLSIPTAGTTVACQVLLNNGDGSGYKMIGQHALAASTSNQIIRLDVATRIPNGAQDFDVGVAASAKVQLFTTTSLTVTAYTGSGILGNFYPYIQVIRR